MVEEKHILVTGAGGFIGHHLVKRFKADGHWVRGVDLKYPDYEASPADKFESLDLHRLDNCLIATRGASKRSITWRLIWGPSAISQRFHAAIARNNILINAHMLEAGRQNGVKRFLFSSSACVYAQSKQRDAEVTLLREEDAFPAEPEPGYGWEKRGSRSFSYRQKRSGLSRSRRCTAMSGEGGSRPIPHVGRHQGVLIFL